MIDIQMDPLTIHFGIRDAELWANGAWTEEVKA